MVQPTQENGVKPHVAVGRPKRTATKVQTNDIYIQRMVRAAATSKNPSARIAEKLVPVMNSLMLSLFDALHSSAHNMMLRGGRKRMTVGDIFTATQIVLPSNIAQRVVQSASHAVDTYNQMLLTKKEQEVAALREKERLAHIAAMEAELARQAAAKAAAVNHVANGGPVVVTRRGASKRAVTAK